MDKESSVLSAWKVSVGWAIPGEVKATKSGTVVESTSVVSFRPVVSLAIPEMKGSYELRALLEKQCQNIVRL